MSSFIRNVGRSFLPGDILSSMECPCNNTWNIFSEHFFLNVITDGCSSAKRPCLGPPSDASSTSCSSSEKSHLTAVADDKRRFTNGDIKQKPKASAENKGSKLSTSASRSIQQDPKASAVYKSLFTSCQEAKKQKQAHWVTFNPQYF